jgi:hypothetical protein
MSMGNKNTATSPETIFTVIPKYLPIKPEGDGCMPLSAALHWIASKGFANAPDACTDAGDQYQAAAKEFSSKVISGKVRVIGADHNQRPETLSPLEFATMRWCFLFNETDLFSEIVANEARIVIMPCGENEQSEDQFWVSGNQPRFTMLQVFREDVRREWPFTLKQGDRKSEAAERTGAEQQTALLEPARERRQLKPGTKPKFDWAAVKQKTFELMGYHGDFSDDDPEWNALARLEEAIRKEMNIEPAESTLRTKVKQYYDEWRTTNLGEPAI